MKFTLTYLSNVLCLHRHPMLNNKQTVSVHKAKLPVMLFVLAPVLGEQVLSLLSTDLLWRAKTAGKCACLNVCLTCGNKGLMWYRRRYVESTFTPHRHV